MSTELKITVSPNFYDLIRRFGATPELASALIPVVDRQNRLTVNAVKMKLSGPVLKVQTGRLRKSIGAAGCYSVLTGGGFELRSSVGSNVGFASGEAVAYAAIHEYGGHTAPHLIKPRSGKALKFTVGGKTVFAALVRHPGSKMPERSYLRSTVRERMPNYSAALGQAAGRFYAGKESE